MFAEHDRGKAGSDHAHGPRVSAEERITAMLELWPERKNNAAKVESFLGALVRLCRQQHSLPPAEKLAEIAIDIVGGGDQRPLAQYSLERTANVAYSLSELGCRESFCYERLGDRVCAILEQAPKAAANHQALSKIAAALAQARHYHRAFFEVADASAAAGGWPPREAVRLLWSHAALAQPNEQLFRSLDRELAPRAGELSFAGMADLISSHASLQVSGDDALAAILAVSRVLHDRLAAGAGADGTPGEDLRKVLQGLAKRGTAAAELAMKCASGAESDHAAPGMQLLALFRTAGDYAVRHFDQLSEQDLVGITGAFSSIRFRYDPLLDVIAGRMGPRLKLCSASGLSTLAHAFYVFERPEYEKFVQSLLRESLGRLGEFTEPAALKGLKRCIIGHVHTFDLAQLADVVERYAALHLLDLELANHVCWALPAKMMSTDPIMIPVQAIRICTAMTAAGIDLVKAPYRLR